MVRFTPVIQNGDGEYASPEYFATIDEAVARGRELLASFPDFIRATGVALARPVIFDDPPKPRVTWYRTRSGDALWCCFTPFPKGDWREIVDYPGLGETPAEAHADWLTKNAEAHPDTSRASREWRDRQ